MRALVLGGSPRRNGNSAAMARATVKGMEDAGHEAKFIFADEVVTTFLKDCRECRGIQGDCTIADGFREAFLNEFLPADGFVVATPIYWYGMSSQIKAFFDRMFCYAAASCPQSAAVVKRMTGKRIGLILSSEETFPTASTGIIHQIQEYSRYTKSTFVGTVHGYGNARGDVACDPGRPLTAAEAFGRDFFTRHATDYQIDTPRPGRVWAVSTATANE